MIRIHRSDVLKQRQYIFYNIEKKINEIREIASGWMVELDMILPLR